MNENENENEEWTLLGRVGVDSGQLMITDPCYLNDEWQGNGFERTTIIYKDERGRCYYCASHGKPKEEPDAIAFDHFDSHIEQLGMSMNEALEAGKVTEQKQKPSGDYSYAGCCAATLGDKGFGQLRYRRGHEGAGVAFASGFGDGAYPVFGRFVEFHGYGRRLAEVRIVLIDDDEV